MSIVAVVVAQEDQRVEALKLTSRPFEIPQNDMPLLNAIIIRHKLKKNIRHKSKNAQTPY